MTLKNTCMMAVAAGALAAAAGPVPNPALMERLKADEDIIGIVHWGLNTFTDREWGFGDENPADLAPAKFDADQICRACAAGGIRGLVVVAKHHDGFCLWPTKTTAHNITKAVNFRGGKGDYVREMADACRRAGMKFGVYVSPWDRNNADYATEKYVETYHAQVRELLSGDYGEIFEMWFDGANGGDGYYGGARERRKIPGNGYYRFGELFKTVRALQPKVTIFGMGGEFEWPGNEMGYAHPERSPSDGTTFRMWEADFPLRPGWFYHAKERGKSKHAAYLMNRYLSSVGNGGMMNIGIAPNRDGRLDEEDVKALKGFKTIKDAFFSHPVGTGAFNVVVTRDEFGIKRIYLTNDTRIDGQRYWADPELVKLVKNATTESGETDTAKWMTGAEKERK